jgi:hypothetical protein
LTLNEDQILTLAPDEASRKSGKDLANPSKWVSTGGNENALWGECKGSGSKPYQTQVDINSIAFKCSCPSRKFPCKHGLGLLLLYVKQKNTFAQTDEPAWVTDWLKKRTEKQVEKTSGEVKPVDEQAQAKRQLARQSKVSNGIEELTLWLKDIVRNGILQMPEKGRSWFDNMAKRMIDAQAPGLAGMIRELADTNFYEEGWQTGFMDQLARIYLVISGYKNMPLINEPLQQDIRSWIGFTQSQEELKEKQGVSDKWLVLSKQTTEEDSLTVERNWLYGTQGNRYALVLQFIIRGQGSQLALTPGVFIDAELVFYPSAAPLRAIIKHQVNTGATNIIQSFAHWKDVAETETILGSQLPFRTERPFIISHLKPVQHNQQWWLQDKMMNIMRMKNSDKKIWKILSLSGGQPLSIAVIGKEDQFEPVGIWQDGEYKML